MDTETNDDCQSSSDDLSLLNTGIFKNNKKSANEPVRQFFEIEKVKKGGKRIIQEFVLFVKIEK